MPNPFEQSWTPAQAGQWRPQTNVDPRNNGYFDPNSNYGGWDYQDPNGDFNQFWEGIRYQYLNQNPQAVWNMWSSPLSGGQNTAFQRYVQSQQGEMTDAYEAALSMNPDLTFQQFLEGFGYGGLYDRFNQQSQQQRGVNIGNVGGGRNQWYAF